MKRILVIGIVTTGLLGCPTASAESGSPAEPAPAAQRAAWPPAASPVLVRLDNPLGAVAWRGMPPGESGGQAWMMQYPASNVAGLFGAILAHVVVTQGAESLQRSERQQKADAVLSPYASQLKSATVQQITRTALGELPDMPIRLMEPEEPAPPLAQVLVMRPVFFLSADQRTVVLDNQVLLYREGDAARPLFNNVVRVVADPRDDDDPVAYWSSGETRLLDVARELLAHSMASLLLAAGRAELDEPARTHRYRFGTEERVERGRLVAQGCGRLLMRTLRDGLMSVPVKTKTEACQLRYRFG